ncbi:hypothetical protein [Stutzerimonas degradans]|uniref:hypothetical protein n=1 Tax=Stutzerimonas degradans TaxID=2968968 RepID=UPI00142378AD|nr:hypothetical protein [Stutzerimonas degradans]NHW02788.1 hypothetical protein [Stutzerimonas degradans]
MANEKLTVAEALHQAEMIDRTLDAWEVTAPQGVAALGGRDALSLRCEMTCIGPVPQLLKAEWERLSNEYEDRRRYGEVDYDMPKR